MKKIADIRYFQSTIPNIDGNSLPTTYFFDAKLFAVSHRIVMKLREQGFSLGDFSHLYLNITTCPVEGGVSIAKYFFKWYSKIIK